MVVRNPMPTLCRAPREITPRPLGPVAAAAHAELGRAVTVLADQNIRTPCQGEDSHFWFSESTEDRTEAARRCAPCPILDLCNTTAKVARERWGVWGGRDRTPKPKSVTLTERSQTAENAPSR